MAALNAGASAVLPSAILVHDARAATLFGLLYDQLFTEPRRMLGAALMAARKQMHDANGGNPFTWCPTVLWGNPDVTLP